MADEDRPQYQSGVGTINGTQFHWGSGTPGKYWSIPYGDYPVTPNAPTGAWAHQVGAIPIANNVIPDPQLGRNRIGIMIHSGSAPSLDQLYTEGCFKVDPQDWPNVRSQILAEASKGPLYLHVAPGGVAAFTNTKTFSQAGDQTPAANANAAANTTAAPSSSAPAQGTTLNSSNVIDTLSRNIAGIESGGWKNPYEALNPTTHAIGKYQVMPQNVPGWTLAATGTQMTPDEFKASPQAQEAVFRDQMQRNLQLYGPKDAASIWFTGKPFNVAGGSAKDATGTTNANYVARATAGLPDSGTFTPGAAVASSTPAAPSAATPSAGGGAVLPGFADAKTSNQFLQNLDQFDKSLGGKGLGLQGQGQGEGQGQPDIRPSPLMPGAGTRNVSSPQSIGMTAQQMLPSLTHYQPQAYGQTLNSDPLAIGAGTPQQPDWLKNAGLQQPSPYGTSIGSMQMAYGLSPQQLQMLMNPMMLAQSGGFS